ncbi:MAG: hypothetical protein H7A37_05945 [Chlamydiales bacterium]|nr:hypothetical protein [Chlamydiia bacterium]MCP5507823.1 hypothetical protein [Chlamydiales bacterium]
MREKGTHTWDLVIQYHRCPECDYVFDNRQQYRYQLGHYIKDVECPRCHHEFRLEKNRKPVVGPFFGNGAPPEMDWGE